MAALNEMSVEYKSTFIKYTNLLDSIGFGLFDETKGLFTWKNAKLLAFSSTFFPFTAIQFSLLSNFGTHDFLEVAQVVPILVMFVSDFFKVAILVLKMEKIKTLFINIGELWPSEWHRSAEQAEIITRLLRRNNKWINIFFTFAVANMFAYEIIPLVNSVLSALSGREVYVLPFQVPDYWPLDNFSVYLISFAYEQICTVPCQMCLYLPTDILIVIFCSNMSILFTVLQSELCNAIQRRPNETTNRLLYHPNQEIYDKIKVAVKTHQQLFRIVSLINDVFGILLLFHMISSSIIICFFGFLAVVYGTIADKALYLMTVFDMTLMIFILAVAGQLLYDASSNVAEAAYQSLWYESDVKIRKTMLFIIRRAQQPAYLSALGFSDMTLRTFSKIMSSAWTYFNILFQSFQDV